MRSSAHPRCIARPRPRVRCTALLLALTLAGCQSLAPAGLEVAPAADAPVAVAPPAAATFGVPDGAVAQVGFRADPPPEEDRSELPRIGPPVVPPPVQMQELDLCMALARAGIENPTIALAVEQVRASEALRLQAEALLLPTLTGGMNVHVHQGTLLSSAGLIRHVNSQSFYFGAGARTLAAESVAYPGIRIFAQLAEAYYAPQIAQQQVVARTFESVAVRNQTLLDVGTAYLELAAAQAALRALQRSEEDVNTIVTMTANFAKTGEGRESDAQRARTVWLLLERQTEEVQGRIAASAAELARLLNADPSQQLVSIDAVPPLLEIIDPQTPLPQLLQVALNNHPELSARSAEIVGAQVRVQQERVRPLLPLLSMGFSYGGFGGRGNQSGGQPYTMDARLDFDVLATWSLQNLGFGNRALQNQALANVGIAETQRLRAVNRIREEVATAYNLILARRREIEIARRRTVTAQKAFDEDLTRARNIEGRPIEVIRSVELLTSARLDLVRSMAAYSEAQLQLLVALGQTPRCPQDVPPDGAACRPD